MTSGPNSNQNRIVLAAAAIAAVMVAVLAALYAAGGHGGGFMARLQSGLSSVTGGSLSSVTGGSPGARTQPQAGGPFAFRRLEIDVSKPQAEACLYFSRTLDASAAPITRTISPSIRQRGWRRGWSIPGCAWPGLPSTRPIM